MFNIPAAHLRVAKKVDITYDLTRLGKLQINRLVKGLRTGIVTGSYRSVPAKIVQKARVEHGAPMLRSHNQEVYWDCMDADNRDNDTFWGLMNAVAIAYKVREGRESYYSQRIRDKKQNGHAHGIEPQLLKRILKESIITTPQSVNKLADDIEAGRITEITVDAHGMNSWF